MSAWLSREPLARKRTVIRPGLICDWWIRVTENALDTVGDMIDITYFGDDLGTQASTVFDPRIYRELVKPHHARMFATIKQRSDAKTGSREQRGDIGIIVGGIIVVRDDVFVMRQLPGVGGQTGECRSYVPHGDQIHLTRPVE